MLLDHGASTKACLWVLSPQLLPHSFPFLHVELVQVSVCVITHAFCQNRLYTWWFCAVLAITPCRCSGTEYCLSWEAWRSEVAKCRCCWLHLDLHQPEQTSFPWSTIAIKSSSSGNRQVCSSSTFGSHQFQINMASLLLCFRFASDPIIAVYSSVVVAASSQFGTFSIIARHCSWQWNFVEATWSLNWLWLVLASEKRFGYIPVLLLQNIQMLASVCFGDLLFLFISNHLFMSSNYRAFCSILSLPYFTILWLRIHKQSELYSQLIWAIWFGFYSLYYSRILQ